MSVDESLFQEVNIFDKNCIRAIWDEHCVVLISRLYKLYTSSSICDITVILKDGIELKAHRVVMASCSQYIDELIRSVVEILPKESSNGSIVVSLNEDSVVFEYLLRFMYCGILSFPSNRMADLWSMSKRLQISGVTEALQQHAAQVKFTAILAASPVNLETDAEHFCNICEHVFDSRLSYRCHMFMSHGPSRNVYTCTNSACNLQFKDKDLLIKHIRTHSLNHRPSWECVSCSLKFDRCSVACWHSKIDEHEAKIRCLVCLSICLDEAEIVNHFGTCPVLVSEYNSTFILAAGTSDITKSDTVFSNDTPIKLEQQCTDDEHEQGNHEVSDWDEYASVLVPAVSMEGMNGQRDSIPCHDVFGDSVKKGNSIFTPNSVNHALRRSVKSSKMMGDNIVGRMKQINSGLEDLEFQRAARQRNEQTQAITAHKHSQSHSPVGLSKKKRIWRKNAKTKFVGEHKKYLCSLCGGTLTGLTAYKRHQLIHTGARPFTCDVCNKTFTQNQRLTVHKRIHTGERPYLCSLCGKTFAESCKLKRHLAKVHNTNKDGETSIALRNSHQISELKRSSTTGDRAYQDNSDGKITTCSISNNVVMNNLFRPPYYDSVRLPFCLTQFNDESSAVLSQHNASQNALNCGGGDPLVSKKFGTQNWQHTSQLQQLRK